MKDSNQPVVPLLMGGALVAVVVRGVVWLMTLGVFGPVLGPLDLLLYWLSGRQFGVILAVEIGLGVAAAGAGIGVGAWAGTGSPRALRAAYWLGWLFLVHAALYLMSIILGTVVALFLAGPGVLCALLPAAVGNGVLCWMALSVVLRTWPSGTGQQRDATTEIAR
jgi:hypothetical protein